MIADARVDGLEADNQRLRDRIDELERLLGMDSSSVNRFPVEWRLTPSEARVLGFLATREQASKEAIMLALYVERPDDPPEIKIVDVFICKLRKKVKNFGIEIETLWGQGYRLSRVMRARLGAEAQAA